MKRRPTQPVKPRTKKHVEAVLASYREAFAGMSERELMILDGIIPEEVASTPADISDEALEALLARLKATSDLDEVRSLSAEIEQLIFHKQRA